MTTHFLEKGHTPNDMRWVVLEIQQPHTDMEKKLLEKEQRWVFRLRSHIVGLNDDIPWGQFT